MMPRAALASGLAVALLTTALGAATAVTSSSAAALPGKVLLYAAPGGTGAACTQVRPCSVLGAQQRERQVSAAADRDVVVLLADGTYRLTAPLRFGPADSGRGGHRVIWTAAPGAHP